MRNFRDYDIIKHPLLTEKATKLLELSNSYVFVVDKTADKKEIKEAFERVFGVKVESVNTMVNKGKTKVFRGRTGRRSDFKKAIIRLEKNSKIDLGIGV